MWRCAFGAVSALLIAGTLAFGQASGRVTHDRSIVPMDIFVGSCFGGAGGGGFDVGNKFTMWLDVYTHYDKQGRITRQENLVKMDPTICYKPENPGRYLESPAENQKMTFVYNEDRSATGQLTGLACKVVVPGYGPVYMETGRLTYTFAAGSFEFLKNSGHNTDDVAVQALCNFLK